MNEHDPAAGKSAGATSRWGTLDVVHMQNSRTESADPYVLVGEPWQGADGVHGPDIQVWPLGPGTGLLLTFSLDEAQTLVEKMLSRIEQARELFPGQE